MEKWGVNKEASIGSVVGGMGCGGVVWQGRVRWGKLLGRGNNMWEDLELRRKIMCSTTCSKFFMMSLQRKSNKKSSPMCMWLAPSPPSGDFTLSISLSLFKSKILVLSNWVEDTEISLTPLHSHVHCFPIFNTLLFQNGTFEWTYLDISLSPKSSKVLQVFVTRLPLNKTLPQVIRATANTTQYIYNHYFLFIFIVYDYVTNYPKT